MKSFAVVVVSVFGRGHDLAASLKKAGMSVALIDLSPELGNWSLEEIEGPFGFLKSDKITSLQLERLNADHLYSENEKGFTAWIGKKLVEMKSPLTALLTQNLALAPEKIGEPPVGDFQKNKYYRFFSSFSSTLNDGPLKSPLKTSLFPSWAQSFFVRQVARQSAERNIQWLKGQGIEVITQAQILDLALKGLKEVHGLELSGQMSGILNCEQLLWFLSSEETKYFSEKLHKKLFKEDFNESSWCWLKYRIQVSDCREREVLPQHWIQVLDIDAPWTHENVSIVLRTASEDLFDVWVKLPTVQRFNKSYLTSRCEDVLQALSVRLPRAALRANSYPQEYYYTYQQLGAPRFPVFEEKCVLPSWKNVHFSSPETWTYYGWDQLLLSNQQLNKDLEQWWMQKQLREQKKNPMKEGQP